MIYKGFYQLLLEYFAQPVELFTTARKVPFTLYAEKQKLFVRNGKNNISRINSSEVAAFVQRYETCSSLLPKDYHDTTF